MTGVPLYLKKSVAKFGKFDHKMLYFLDRLHSGASICVLKMLKKHVPCSVLDFRFCFPNQLWLNGIGSFDKQLDQI